MDDIGFLEKVLLDGISLVSEETAEQFGKSKKLVKMVENKPTNEALTERDLENQEIILQHLYQHAPWVGISVEERLENPSLVQKKLYDNVNAQLLVQLDPVDGTLAYRDGIRKDYGIIASVLEKVSNDLGKFRLGIMHYPSLGYSFVADDSGLYYLKDERKVLVKKNQDKAKRIRRFYSATSHMTPERLGVNCFMNDIYSITQMLLQLVSYEISGFLTCKGHVNDHSVGAWMAQQWGADVEYASGARFDYVPFGDAFIQNRRVAPRDENGLLIAGTQGDGDFEFYQGKKNKPFRPQP